MKLVLAVMTACLAVTQTVSAADCACTICPKPGECTGCAEKRSERPDCCKDRSQPSRCTHLNPSSEIIPDSVDLPTSVAGVAEFPPADPFMGIVSEPAIERPAGIARGRPLYLLHSILLI